MKAIVVEEDRFNELFQQTLDKLKLDQFTESNVARSQEQLFATQDMHRRFHYEVCRLKSALERAGKP